MRRPECSNSWRPRRALPNQLGARPEYFTVDGEERAGRVCARTLWRKGIGGTSLLRKGLIKMWRVKKHPLGRRQQRIRNLSRQGWRVWATIGGFLAVIWGAAAFYGISESRKARASDNLPEIALEAKSDFIYDMAHLQPNQSRFFTVPASSSERSRLLIQRDVNGVIRTVFAACRACYSQHMDARLSDGMLMCRHCQQSMRFGDQNERVAADSCVAVPVRFSVENNKVKVRTQEVMEGLKNFAKANNVITQPGDTSRPPNSRP
jgi:uncharacterized membrane protein